MNPITLFLIASFGTCLLHILTTLVGSGLGQLVPTSLTEWLTVALFIGLGAQSVYESYRDYKKALKRRAKGLPEKDTSSSDEREELEQELKEHEMWIKIGTKPKKSRLHCKNPVLYFLALLMFSEFGDKSQISALTLAANYPLLSVILGGCAAQISCIMLAMAVGKIIEKNCSEKLTGLVGGILFVVFGLFELWEILD